MPRRRNPSDDRRCCPTCGADLPPGAESCRECGSSDESGWGDKTDTWQDESGGYGDDDEFDYDEFVRSEFPDQAPKAKPSLKRVLLAVIVILLCLGLLFWMF